MSKNIRTRSARGQSTDELNASSNSQPKATRAAKKQNAQNPYAPSQNYFQKTGHGPSTQSSMDSSKQIDSQTRGTKRSAIVEQEDDSTDEPARKLPKNTQSVKPKVAPAKRTSANKSRRTVDKFLPDLGLDEPEKAIEENTGLKEDSDAAEPTEASMIEKASTSTDQPVALNIASESVKPSATANDASHQGPSEIFQTRPESERPEREDTISLESATTRAIESDLTADKINSSERENQVHQDGAKNFEDVYSPYKFGPQPLPKTNIREWIDSHYITVSPGHRMLKTKPTFGGKYDTPGPEFTGEDIQKIYTPDEYVKAMRERSKEGNTAANALEKGKGKAKGKKASKNKTQSEPDTERPKYVLKKTRWDPYPIERSFKRTEQENAEVENPREKMSRYFHETRLKWTKAALAGDTSDAEATTKASEMMSSLWHFNIPFLPDTVVQVPANDEGSDETNKAKEKSKAPETGTDKTNGAKPKQKSAETSEIVDEDGDDSTRSKSKSLDHLIRAQPAGLLGKLRVFDTGEADLWWGGIPFKLMLSDDDFNYLQQVYTIDTKKETAKPTGEVRTRMLISREMGELEEAYNTWASDAKEKLGLDKPKPIQGRQD